MLHSSNTNRNLTKCIIIYLLQWKFFSHVTWFLVLVSTQAVCTCGHSIRLFVKALYSASHPNNGAQYQADRNLKAWFCRHWPLHRGNQTLAKESVARCAWVLDKRWLLSFPELDTLYSQATSCWWRGGELKAYLVSGLGSSEESMTVVILWVSVPCHQEQHFCKCSHAIVCIPMIRLVLHATLVTHTCISQRFYPPCSVEINTILSPSATS